MTRRQLGWAYLGVGAAVLAAWPLSKLSAALAARSLAKLTPAPFATIDAPAPNALVPAEVVVAGRVAHETIRAPLWLLSSEGGREWKPQREIATGAPTWHQQLWLGGRKGMRYRLVVVAAEMPSHNSFTEKLAHPEAPLWMRDPEARFAAAAYWRTAPLGDGRYPPLPAGTGLVAAVDVVMGQNEVTVELPILLPPRARRPLR